MYSDGGFGVLGRVLERMTGLPYREVIYSVLSRPLGLNYTTTFIPKDENLNAVVIVKFIGIRKSSYRAINSILLLISLVLKANVPI